VISFVTPYLGESLHIRVISVCHLPEPVFSFVELIEKFANANRPLTRIKRRMAELSKKKVPRYPE